MLKRLLGIALLCGLTACSTGYERVAVGPQSMDQFVDIAKKDREKMQLPDRVKIGKPYSSGGKIYSPKYNSRYVATGLASWYGPGFHGKKTANGEVYNKHDLTAAHPTLPLPSMVRVTNLENGRELIVRVNDRGPFAKDRIIDLSGRAADLLGMKQQGVAQVRVELLDQESRYFWKQLGMTIPPTIGGAPGKESSERQYASMEPAAGDIQSPHSPFVNPSAGDSERNEREIEAINKISMESLPTPKAEEHALNIPRFIRNAEAANLPQGSSASGIYVQAGAFSDPTNAQRASLRVSELGETRVLPVAVNGQTLYRVRLGPLNAKSDAEQMRSQLMELGYNEAKLVRE